MSVNTFGVLVTVQMTNAPLFVYVILASTKLSQPSVCCGDIGTFTTVRPKWSCSPAVSLSTLRCSATSRPLRSKKSTTDFLKSTAILWTLRLSHASSILVLNFSWLVVRAYCICFFLYIKLFTVLEMRPWHKGKCVTELFHDIIRSAS